MFERLRKWLIRKLGGYVEPKDAWEFDPCTKVAVRTVVARPEILTCEQRMPCYRMSDVPQSYVQMEMETKIAKMLVVNLLNCKMIQFIRSYDRDQDELVVRGKLLVCRPPEDGEMNCAVDNGTPIL